MKGSSQDIAGEEQISNLWPLWSGSGTCRAGRGRFMKGKFSSLHKNALLFLINTFTVLITLLVTVMIVKANSD